MRGEAAMNIQCGKRYKRMDKDRPVFISEFELLSSRQHWESELERNVRESNQAIQRLTEMPERLYDSPGHIELVRTFEALDKENTNIKSKLEILKTFTLVEIGENRKWKKQRRK